MIVDFASGLDRFGDKIALIGDGDEPMSYSALASAADAFLAKLGSRPQLLIIEAMNDRATMVALLGALRGRHPVILTAPGGDAKSDLALRFGASAVVRGGNQVSTGYQSPPMHPNLAVMLSTSGTTGSTKLVRLSHDNLAANAIAIAEYLEITHEDRAITSLSPHYSYGLSVLTSHLASGAAIVLNDHSVADLDFRNACIERAITSIAGVPYSYELLERVGFRDWAPQSLRTMTQAGGSLSPLIAARFGAWSEERGVRFFVMYGQTEATARIAYVPPTLLADNPGCIGLAIPGGELTLVDGDGQLIRDDAVEGELIYRGANVMMGYASAADDLARKSELESLATGDLAVRQANGLFRITGRMSRFVKPFGLRVNLDQIEEILRLDGVHAAVAGNDGLIAVAVSGVTDSAAISARLAEALRLPENIFHVSSYEELPRLASGKTDYTAILNWAIPEESVRPSAELKTLVSVYQATFPTKQVRDSDSFVGLGGDSLNYIALTAEIEERVGHLPEGWETMAVGQLEDIANRSTMRGDGELRWVESEIAVRAMAICAVVANHASDWPVGGGADALLVLVGLNLARFHFPRFVDGKFWQSITGFAPRILLPYYGLLAVYALIGKPVSFATWILVSNFEGRFGTLLEPYWFIEAFFQCLLILALIGCIPLARNLARKSPLNFGLLFLAAAIIAKMVAAHIASHEHLLNRTPDEIFIFVALGWCIHFSRAPLAKFGMFSVALLFGLASFQNVLHGWWHVIGDENRGIWVAATSALLLYARRMSMPAFFRRATIALSSASFTIYMVHIIVIDIIQTRLAIHFQAATIVAGILSGYLVHVALARTVELAFARWGKNLEPTPQAVL